MKGAAFFKFLFFLFASTAFAQITHPKASPYSELAQYIGLTKISIEYSRPAVRGRVIMGELVPFGRIWRVGANESTRFTVNQPIKIAGHQLKIGSYALYAIPNKTSWEIIIHGNTKHWGDGRENYNSEEDVFRFTIEPENSLAFQENFLITFDHITHNSAVMNWLWEHTKISIPITVDTHAQMLEEINRQLASNPSGITYYEAARYLQEQSLQPKKALLWLDKAQELNGKTYYFHRVRSLVLASLEQYDRALQEAQLSLEIADSLGKDEFVRMNEKNIKIWTKKL